MTRDMLFFKRGCSDSRELIRILTESGQIEGYILVDCDKFKKRVPSYITSFPTIYNVDTGRAIAGVAIPLYINTVGGGPGHGVGGGRPGPGPGPSSGGGRHNDEDPFTCYTNDQQNFGEFRPGGSKGMIHNTPYGVFGNGNGGGKGPQNSPIFGGQGSQKPSKVSEEALEEYLRKRRESVPCGR